jgi:cbb3-type cytochrome oxidase subunit 3
MDYSTKISNLVSIVSSLVNAITIVVLAVITYGYSRSAKRQADSASEQALAAQEQAAFSEQSLKALQAHESDLAQADRLTIDVVIESSIRTAQFWSDPEEIITLCVRRALPQNIFLVPAYADKAVECATRVKQAYAKNMAVAFDHLRMAQMRIESMRSTPVAEDSNYRSKYANEATAHIQLALEALRNSSSTSLSET